MTHFHQNSEILAPGHPTLLEREEKNQSQACFKAVENNSRHLIDAVFQRRLD